MLNLSIFMKLYDRHIYHKLKPEDKWEENCPFCDYESEEQRELIVWRGEYFYVLHNKFPYLGLKTHLLAVPYRHICFTKDLSIEEFQDLKNVEQFVSEFYGSTPYFSFIREVGHYKSLNHLHYHFLPWEITEDAIEEMLKNQWI